jgi:hypothetical protein
LPRATLERVIRRRNQAVRVHTLKLRKCCKEARGFPVASALPTIRMRAFDVTRRAAGGRPIAPGSAALGSHSP